MIKRQQKTLTVADDIWDGVDDRRDSRPNEWYGIERQGYPLATVLEQNPIILESVAAKQEKTSWAKWITGPVISVTITALSSLGAAGLATYKKVSELEYHQQIESSHIADIQKQHDELKTSVREYDKRIKDLESHVKEVEDTTFQILRQKR